MHKNREIDNDEEDNKLPLLKRTIRTQDSDPTIKNWRGGKTIPENARLTHRYCNRFRKKKESSIILRKDHNN